MVRMYQIQKGSMSAVDYYKADDDTRVNLIMIQNQAVKFEKYYIVERIKIYFTSNTNQNY